MVKKLFKYEFTAFFRSMLPIYIALIGIGIFTKAVQFFENDTLAYDISFISSVVLLCVGSVAALLMAFIIMLRRFYKNLFTSEGYLSFTLPVTPAQHILVKGVAALVFYIATFFAVIISAAIACDFDMLREIFKAINYCVGYLYKHFSPANLTAFIAEIIFVLLLDFAVGILLYYACIAIGQMAKKNRVAAAIGVYFGIYIIYQIIGTVFVIVSAIISATSWFDKLLNTYACHPYIGTHLIIAAVAVVLAGLGVLFFFITHKIMRTKLNLE